MGNDESFLVTFKPSYYLVMAWLGIFTLGLFFVAAWFTSRKYPRRIGADGIELRNGSFYPWARVRSAVRPRDRYGAERTTINIVFDDGLYTQTSADAIARHEQIRALLVRRGLLA